MENIEYMLVLDIIYEVVGYVLIIVNLDYVEYLWRLGEIGVKVIFFVYDIELYEVVRKLFILKEVVNMLVEEIEVVNVVVEDF